MLSNKKLIRILLFSILISMFFCVACNRSVIKENTTAELTILYTNDEHGWMEPTKYSGGAAGLMGLWKEKEDYTLEGPFLVLSGGDLWTGPAISTWTKGESMTAVLNALGYDMAAIGNHEFDFKLSGMRDRASQAKFPLMGANIREKSTGKQADIATPYIIKEVNNIKVGIIGLSSTDTPTSTFPDYVEDFDFINCADAVREYFPKVKEEGAELVIIVGHFGEPEMEELVPVAKELGIPIIGGGHSHQRVSKMVDGVALIEAGGRMGHYGKIELLFDTAADTIITLSQELVKNQGGKPNAEIDSIVTFWRVKVDSVLSEVIGFVDNDIRQSSNEMYNMIMDSWLVKFPSADIAMTNSGGIRQGILAGDVTLEEIIGVLPFENNLVELDLTGEEVIDCLGRYVIGGIIDNQTYMFSDSTFVHPDSVYNVLTIDYLYSRSDTHFSEYDDDPVQTHVNYRQPVIDWIKSMNTSKDNSLDQYLNDEDRRK